MKVGIYTRVAPTLYKVNKNSYGDDNKLQALGK